MRKRSLGNSGLEVAPLAFGGNVFGWTVDERTSFRLLDAFVAAGFNLIDTADAYSRFAPGNHGGESETIIGKWLKQGRQTRQSHHCHKGRAGDGSAHERLVEGLYSARGRRFFEAAGN